MQNKSFVDALTRTQVKKEPPDPKLWRPPAGPAIQNLVDVRWFSRSIWLTQTIAQVWRAAKCFAGQKMIMRTPKWEAVSSTGVITVTEHQYPLRDLFLAAQDSVTFPATTVDRLVVYKEDESVLLVCGGRVQAFIEDRVGVPLLPHSA